MSARLFFSAYYWRCYFSPKKVVKAIFVFWGCTVSLWEVAAVFIPSIEIPSDIRLVVFLVLLGLSVLAGLWVSRPRFHISHRLHDMDIVLEIIVADMFKLRGQYVIGTNTTFDTTLGMNFISPKSLQGQFTRKYYDDVAHLDSDLEAVLRLETHQTDNTRTKGKNKKYQMGTVAKISPKSQTAYFVAIADMNDHGNAQSTFENLKKSLASLWDFLLNRGDMEPLIMPILGTGFSRINERRESIVHEIVSSFIAACSSRKFCEKLTIVIHPRDLAACDIKWGDLDKYVEHVCRYTSHRQRGVGAGVGIQDSALKDTRSDKNKVPNLMAEAKELLIEASKDLSGNILKMRFIGSSLMIQTNGKKFAGKGNPKDDAAWEHALKQLCEYGLVSAVGFKGEVFKITHQGYQTAEQLKSSV